MKKIIFILCILLSQHALSADSHPKCLPNPCDEIEPKNTASFKNISLAEVSGLRIGASQVETMKLMNGLRPSPNDASKNLRSVGCGDGWKCNFKIADAEVQLSQLNYDKDKLISAVFRFNPESKTEISKKSGYRNSTVYYEVYTALQSKYGNESKGSLNGGDAVWIFGNDEVVIGLYQTGRVCELEFFNKNWQVANRAKPKVYERTSEVEGK